MKMYSIFPDWQQDEEELSSTLAEVLSAIASHPQASDDITLAINWQKLNLIIFPDWQQKEEELSLTLAEVLRAIASHPQAAEITLIFDITNAESEEEANLLVSGVTMNLMLEEGIELSETTEIAFIGNLTSQQWEKLFNLIQYKIEISSELLPFDPEKLPSCKIEDIARLATC